MHPPSPINQPRAVVEATAEAYAALIGFAVGRPDLAAGLAKPIHPDWRAAFDPGIGDR